MTITLVRVLPITVIVVIIGDRVFSCFFLTFRCPLSASFATVFLTFGPFCL